MIVFLFVSILSSHNSLNIVVPYDFDRYKCQKKSKSTYLCHIDTKMSFFFTRSILTVKHLYKQVPCLYINPCHAE